MSNSSFRNFSKRYVRKVNNIQDGTEMLLILGNELVRANQTSLPSNFSNYGDNDQIPFMQSSNQFIYSENFKFNGSTLNVVGTINVDGTIETDQIDDNGAGQVTFITDITNSGGYNIDTDILTAETKLVTDVIDSKSSGGITVSDDLELGVNHLIATNITSNGTIFTDILDDAGTGEIAVNTDMNIDGSITSVDSIQFDIAYVPGAGPEGLISWNTTDMTLNIHTGVGPVLQVGFEDWFIVYNNTGIDIDNGDVIHPIAGATGGIPNVELAQANIPSGVDRAIWVATMDIPNGTSGIATQRGNVRGIDTHLFNVGDNIYVSPDTPGAFTATKPAFPDYPIQVGGVAIADAINGEIIVSIKGEIEDTIINYWNGEIRESFDFRVTSTGGVITGTLTPANGHPDLTMMFSDGLTILDTDPGATIILTAGTDTDPVVNYVFITKANKVLEISLVDYPRSEEFIAIGEMVLQSAATTETDGGAYGNQNVNNEIQDTTTNQGHLFHEGDKLRSFPAGYYDGIDTSLNGTPDDGWIACTSGRVRQLHLQDFDALDMQTGDIIKIINDPANPNRSTDNLNTITVDAEGSSLNNRWFSFVVLGIQNKSGEPSFFGGNLPIGSYTSETSAVADALNYAVYNIPKHFTGKAFLAARFTMRLSPAGLTYNSLVGYQDLRGRVPNSTSGSSGGGVTSWLGLTDTESSYTGFSGQAVIVNGAENGLEFTDSPTFVDVTASGTIYTDIIDDNGAGSLAINTIVGIGGAPDVDAMLTVSGTGGVLITADYVNIPSVIGLALDYHYSDDLARISVADGAAGWTKDLAIQPYGGNLLIGSTTDSGEKLQVTGTVLITGNITATNLSGTNTGDQDLSGLVPYTGATTNVVLGSNDLTVKKVFVTGSTTAGSSSIDIESSDPSIRLKWTGEPVVADENTYEIRNIGTTATTYLQFRTINDAETVFTTRMALWNSGGLYLGNTPTDPGAGKLITEGGATIGGNTSIAGDCDVTGTLTVDTIDDSGAGSLAINTSVGINTTPLLGLHVVSGTAATPATTGASPTGTTALQSSDSDDAIIFGTYDAIPFGSWIQSQDITALGTNRQLAINPNGGNVGVGTDYAINTFVVSNGGALGLEVIPGASSGTVVELLAYDRVATAYKKLSFLAAEFDFNANVNVTGDLDVTGAFTVGTFAAEKLDVNFGLSVYVGTNAGANDDESNNSNVGVGVNALNANTTGSSNLALGYGSGIANTIGAENIFMGAGAGAANTEGDGNIVLGTSALLANTKGNHMVAIGRNTLRDFNLTTDTNGLNVAIGDDTARGLVTGTGNTIIGAGVSGLASALTNNIILAAGGATKAQFDGTDWVMSGDMTLSGGVLTLFETTEPSDLANYGQIYTKSDNKLYVKTGDNVEHEIAYV